MAVVAAAVDLDEQAGIQLLNNMFLDDTIKGNKRKSYKQQLLDNATSIFNSAEEVSGPLMMDFFAVHGGPCRIQKLSLDTRNRPQRSIKVYDHQSRQSVQKHFRSYQVTWIAKYGPAPLGLGYSHRCHEPLCVNPDHGVWQNDANNQDRGICQNASHLILPNLMIITLCPHKPNVCLTPLHIEKWTDPRIHHPDDQ